MTIPTPLDPAHRLVHARAAAVLQLVQPLGPRAEMTDALAYLIGYETASGGGDINEAIKRATAIARLGYETARR